MNKRTVLHAAQTSEVYAPLFARYPNHLTLGDSEHGFFSCVLSDPLLAPDAEYDKMDLCDSGMEGEMLYAYIVEQLEAGYMDAIEFTKEQAATMIGLNQPDTPEGDIIEGEVLAVD